MSGASEIQGGCGVAGTGEAAGGGQDWTEIVVSAPTAALPHVEAALHMATALGLYVEDYSDLEDGVRRVANIDLIEDDLLNKDRGTARVHVYFPPGDNPAECLISVRERLSAAAEAADMNGCAVDIKLGTVREEDWANNWKRYFKPFKVGKGILICPGWIGHKAVGEYRYMTTGEFCGGAVFDGVTAVVSIDPGMAFGTGGHVTTRLCLELVEGYVGGRADGAGVSVLDVGAGSGILSITAALLGAGSALGVDIDGYAVRNARANAEHNGVDGRARFVEGDLAAAVSGRYTLICANIVADVIIRLFGDVRRLLAPGGAFVCSGIITEREADVAAAAREHGFTPETVLREDGWVAMRYV